MTITNRERVGKAVDLLRTGLAPFAEREFKSAHGAKALVAARRYLGEDRTVAQKRSAVKKQRSFFVALISFSNEVLVMPSAQL